MQSKKNNIKSVVNVDIKPFINKTCLPKPVAKLNVNTDLVIDTQQVKPSALANNNQDIIEVDFEIIKERKHIPSLIDNTQKPVKKSKKLYDVIGYPKGSGPWGDYYSIITTFDLNKAMEAIEKDEDYSHMKEIDVPDDNE